MRIVGGQNKGRRLKVSKTRQRPTKAIVREAIFDILKHYVVDSDVLDIFAGTGSLGLEALSRGASHCTFIERYPRVLTYNIQHLSYSEQTKIIVSDFRSGLKYLKGKEFDIIFLDPPYRRQYLTDALRLIAALRILNKNGIIVAEHDVDKKLEIPEDMKHLKTYIYGDTALTCIRYY
jgi:16S rRNA (guanine966-N2)-methyltransferase